MNEVLKNCSGCGAAAPDPLVFSIGYRLPVSSYEADPGKGWVMVIGSGDLSCGPCFDRKEGNPVPAAVAANV